MMEVWRPEFGKTAQDESLGQPISGKPQGKKRMKGTKTMAKAVTIIPATKDKFTALPTSSIQKRRVAAYARVSTDSDEQFTSYEAQIDYYTQYIKKRDN